MKKKQITVIDSFSGKYRFLSNFFPCTIVYNGIQYESAEAAYQAQKSPEYAHAFIGVSPMTAKKLGKRVKLRSDWEQVKVKIMQEIVYEKFTQNSELKQKLLDTDRAELIEGNSWGDTFWGICNGKGENYLGYILMQVRDQLRGSPSFRIQ